MTKTLENVRLLKIKVGGFQNSLMDALEMAIDSWMESVCDVDVENINLLIIGNHEDLDKKMESRDPFICLYPEREDAWKPEDGFEEPIKLFKPAVYKNLEPGYKKAIVLQKVGDLIKNPNFISKHLIEYRKRNPTPRLGQGAAYQDSYTIEYDVDYYESFLCISFSGYVTYS
jgi:hypothetical protein